MEDILKKFGIRIRELRNERGWSQEKMAQICGFDRTYIGRIERGERNISLKNINRVATVFKLSLSELMDGVGQAS